MPCYKQIYVNLSRSVLDAGKLLHMQHFTSNSANRIVNLPHASENANDIKGFGISPRLIKTFK